jgi:hypothetical protein
MQSVKTWFVVALVTMALGREAASASDACAFGSFDTPTFGCVEMCDLDSKAQEVVDFLMNTNTRVVATNVTCENTALQLAVCDRRARNATDTYTSAVVRLEGEMTSAVATRDATITGLVSERNATAEEARVCNAVLAEERKGAAVDADACMSAIEECQVAVDACAADPANCRLASCDAMEEPCGLPLTVVMPSSTSVDDAVREAVVMSEFELWGTMPCFAYHALRNTATGLQSDSTWQQGGLDEAECWDTCSGSADCQTALFDGDTCWHKNVTATAANTAYAAGYATLVPCVGRNETMFKDIAHEVVHMGEVILFYSLEANDCGTCTGYNRLVDIDTTPGVQLGDTVVNVSEANCWARCEAYAGGACEAAVHDGLSCTLKREAVSNATSRYTPGMVSLYACAPVAPLAPAPPAPAAPPATDRSLEVDFLQFKLDVNTAAPECEDFNILGDTDMTHGEHILRACEVTSAAECWDVCTAFTGSDDGPCASAVYMAPHCWLKNATVSVETTVYSPGFATLYPCA